jgi:CheY-like chemotaxis protein
MKLLLVEDEPGLREGLAAFLRLKGCIVRTATGVADAVAALDGEDYDAMVTDWRLGDGLSRRLVESAPCPTIVVSGHPEEVDVRAARILGKPVQPRELLAELVALVELAGRRAATPVPARSTPAIESLPADAVDRIALMRFLLGDPADVNVADDGVVVTCTFRGLGLGGRAEAAATVLGGDLRVASGAPDLPQTVTWRLLRDGRPDESLAVVGPTDPWPDADVAIDFSRGPIDPDRLLALAEAARLARCAGRRVLLLNVPSHLRLWLEAFGIPDDMPKRDPVGPRLPADLAELWR